MDTQTVDTSTFVKELVKDKRPLSSIVFSLMFSNNLALAQLVISIILSSIGLKLELKSLPVAEYNIVNPYRTLDTGKDGHSVRLDVIALTDKGDIVDLESQLYTDDLERRIGFYTATMRMHSLGSGEDYGKMKRIYTIWITDFDLFGKEEGKGKVLYHFGGRKEIGGDGLLDDLVEVFVFNAKAAARVRKKPAWRKLGHDLTMAENSSQMLYNGIAEAYRSAAETKEAQIRMEDTATRIFKEYREQVVKETTAKVQAETTARNSEEIALNMMRMNLTNAQIAEATKLSPVQVSRLRVANGL